MYTGDLPPRSFAPPPPLGYQHPLADKPTLRGTNSDSVIYNNGGSGGVSGGGGAVGNSGATNGGNLIRRPIPPPSLMPGQERIPYRPPELGGGSIGSTGIIPNIPSGGSLTKSISESNNDPQYSNHNKMKPTPSQNYEQRKKALNTPAQNKHNIDFTHDIRLENGNLSDALPNSGVLYPSISRILSGSNGRKEDIPAVLLRTVTLRPSFLPPIHQSENDQQTSTNLNNNRGVENSLLAGNDAGDDISSEDNNSEDVENEDLADDFDMFSNQNLSDEEPKTQPKIKQAPALKSTQSPLHQSDSHAYSTPVIQNIAKHPHTTIETIHGENNVGSSSSDNGRQNQRISPGSPITGNNNLGSIGGVVGGSSSTDTAPWTVAWNIHVYLSAILFTILAVYSIFKMIFYDKLTHLFNQSYFICIHLLLITICLARIFFLCYDAYNIHSSFHTFISELLLNLPATFLTISFAILILFLLIRSLNHKNNRYSALMRPLTVVVGSSVHVGLCVTLHYVESTSTQSQHHIYQAKNSYNSMRNGIMGSGNMHHSPPRVLSLICQIIYIFVCLSLGLFYLYIYRILKRILRNKSQNYIHGYQNLSYAIHITIATALLFILLAALQVYGAVSISTTRPLISLTADIDWLQCGYQFSLRLIEIAIITLMSWVTGLKTGASKVLQREKGLETHNVSGFALFPCTSSSSQEHFETDYPAICNANTNLHTYTLRTGKPIYDDNFALNSIGMDNPLHQQQQMPSGHTLGRVTTNNGGVVPAEFQIPNSNEFTRNYETNSARSSTHTSERDRQINDGGFLNDSGNIPDHYENPNFELRSSARGGGTCNLDIAAKSGNNSVSSSCAGSNSAQQDLVLDNNYSEPLSNQPTRNQTSVGLDSDPYAKSQSNFDFQNFEKPTFDRPLPAMTGNGGSANEFRASKNLKVLKNNNNQLNHLDRQQYDNPERKSSNSTAYASGRNFNNLNFQSHHNSFERRGIRKSGTLNNIGGNGCVGAGSINITVSGTHNRNGISSTSSSSSNGGGRPSGVHTLSTSRSQQEHHLHRIVPGRMSQQQLLALQHKKDRHRSSIEHTTLNHSNHGTLGNVKYATPNDDHEYSSGCRPFDSTSNASSDGGTSITGGTALVSTNNSCIRYQSDRNCGAASGIHFKQMHQIPPQHQSITTNNDINLDALHSCSSSGESTTSGSMLVAEHGFVRFRAIDNGTQQQLNTSSTTAQHLPPQHLNASCRTSHTRGKEKSYTDS